MVTILSPRPIRQPNLMAKKSIRILSILILGGLLIGLGIQRYYPSTSPESNKEKTTTSSSSISRSQSLSVNTIVLKSTTLTDQLTISGTLEPDEQVDIKSEIAGKVEAIYFKEGTYVSKGKVLLEIEHEELTAQIKRTKLQQELAQQKEQRRKELLEKGGLSEEEYEVALTEYKSLVAEVEELTAQEKKTRIKAPFSGKIGFRYISEGSYLSPGTEIAQLVKVNPIKVTFSVPERFSQNVNLGMDIQFTVEGLSETFSGRLYAKDPSIDPNTRTQLVKARSPNPGVKLLPGSFARIIVPLKAFNKTLAVPTEAVIPELGRQKVFVYKNGKAVEKVIETGIRQAENIQVLSGLSEGDTLITSGILQVRPGMEVQLKAMKEN